MTLEIKCPYCGYDGSDDKIGSEPIGVDVIGVPHIICSKCKRRFVVKELIVERERLIEKIKGVD